MVIIKSGKKNWTGKEFNSEYPAKIYSTFREASEAIENYHFWEYDENKQNFVEAEKKQKLEFFFLSEKRKNNLLSRGLVRF